MKISQASNVFFFSLNRIRKIFICSVLIFSFYPVIANDLRIGFVNTERILRESIPAKAAQIKIEGEFNKREEILQSLNNDLNYQTHLFEKESPIMSEKDRFEKQRLLDNLENELHRKRREFQEDLGRRRNEEFSIVIEKANEIIKNIAEKENYDLILQEAITVSSRIDITDEVMKNLE